MVGESPAKDGKSVCGSRTNLLQHLVASTGPLFFNCLGFGEDMRKLNDNFLLPSHKWYCGSRALQET